ncbi:MAG: S-layer homology domain-containing protein [Clostridia bacterium]|nr:S-layer homology domain-containing protein [Clostridia bacterium]
MKLKFKKVTALICVLSMVTSLMIMPPLSSGAVDIALDDAKWILSHQSNFTIATDKLGSDISTLSYNGWAPASGSGTSYAQIVTDPKDSSNHVLKNVTPYNVEGIKLPYINLKKNNIPLSGKIKASMRVNIAPTYSTSFTIELQDENGARILRLRLREPLQSNKWAKRDIYSTSSSSDTAVSLGKYSAQDTWFKLDFIIDTTSRTFDVYLDNSKLNTDGVPFYYGSAQTTNDASNIGYLSFRSWKNITGADFGANAQSDDVFYIDDVEIYTYEEEDTPVDESLYPYVGGNFKEEWDVAHYSDFTVADSMLGKCVCQIHGKYQKWDRTDRTFYSLSTNLIKEPEKTTNCVMEMVRTAYTGSASQKEEAAYSVARDSSGNAISLSGKVDAGMRLKEKTASDVNFTVALRDSQAPGNQYWVNGKYIAMLLFKNGKISVKTSSQETQIGTYPRGKWFHLEIKADTTQSTYNVYIDGVKVNETAIAFYSSSHNSTISVIEYNIEKAGTTGTWYVDDVALWKDRTEDFTAFKGLLTDSVLSTESLDSITKNLNLLTQMNGYKIEWESSLPDVITTDGVVYARNEKTDVTLTANITSDADATCLKRATTKKTFNVTVEVAREKPEIIPEPSIKDANFKETWEVHHYSNFTVDNSKIGSTVYGYNNWDRIDRANKTYTSNFIMDPDKMNNYLLELNRFNSSSGNERPYLVLKDGDGEVKGLTGKVNIGMRLNVKEASDKPFTVVARDSALSNYWTNGAYMIYLSFNQAGTITARRNGSSIALGEYPTDRWFELIIEADTVSRTYDAYIDGEKINTVPLAFYYEGTENDRGDISIVELDIQKEGTKGVWHVDDVTVWQDREEELTAIADAVTQEDISSEPLSAITADLNELSLSVSGKTVTWESDNKDALTDDGKVTRSSYTQEAKLTAKISYSDDASLVQNAKLSKSFDLKILKSDSASADSTLGAVAENWLTEERISYEKLTEITKHLRILPAEAPDGVAISWVSDKTGFITNDGLVTRPAIGQADETVTLTATLSKAGAQDVTKTFTLIVKAYPTAEAVLQRAKEALDLSLITYEKANAIKNRLYYIYSIEGAGITWSSSNTDVIKSDGTVVRGDTNIDVVLTATLSYNGETLPVTFNLKVLKNPAKTMQEDLDAITIPETLLKDYSLDKTGSVNMSAITWSSSNTDVIRIANYVAYVTRPEFTDGDKTVTLTAKIVLEGITQSRSFNIKVTKLPSDEDLVNDVYNLLTEAYITAEDPNAITRNLALQTEFDGGVEVEWVSSPEGIIDGFGNVTNPDVGEGDVTVTLTAKISKRDASSEKTIPLTVKPFASEKEKVERAAEELSFSNISSESIKAVTLPLNLVTEWKFGTSISWSSSSGYLSITQDGEGNTVALINPPAYGSGAQTAELIATVSNGVYSKSKSFTLTISEEKAYTEIYNHNSDALEVGADPKQGTGSFTNFPPNTPAKVHPAPGGMTGNAIRFLKSAGATAVSGVDELIYYAPASGGYVGQLVVGGKFYMPDNENEKFLDNFFFYEVMGVGTGVQLPIRFCRDGKVQAGINEKGQSKYLVTKEAVFEKNTWVDFRFEVDAEARRYHIYINDVCVSEDGRMVTTNDNADYSTWLGIPYVKFETSSSKQLGAYRLSMAAGKHEADSVFYLDDMYMLQQNELPLALQTAIDTFEREFLSANKLEAISADLVIPKINSSIINYSYYSDNTSVISTEGKVTRPAQDEKVIFSVEVSLGSDTIRRDYPVTVKAIEPAEAAQKDLDEAISAIKATHNLGAVVGNISLSSAKLGSDVKITYSSDENAVSLSGTVTRGNSDKTVTITITAKNGGEEKSETITLTVKQKAAASTTTSYEASSTVPTVSGHSSNAGGGGNSGIEIKPIEKPKMEFNDLSSSHWAYEAIKALWEDGIVKGVTENTFEPERNVTREEFAKLLACTTDISPKNKDIAFSDVPETRWSYQYIRTLATNGIINGQAEGHFGANANVSRQDMAVMIYRALSASGVKLEKVRTAPQFADSAMISSYAREAVTELYTSGIINGIYDWEFAPERSATRAQAATILNNLMQKIN